MFTSFSKNLKDDISAGIAVYLVGVPLSLGIAMASGAPPLSGLITGIIGGLIVSQLSGSVLGISGTAAGLTVIILAAIQQLGFNAFLLAVVLAGLIQVVLGILRAGVIAYYFPSSVINGMMYGIGLILFLKQIPHAVGYDRDFEGDVNFIQSDQYSSFSEIFHVLGSIAPGAVLISSLSLASLLIWEFWVQNRHPLLRLLQGGLVALLVGVLSNFLLGKFYPSWALSGAHLVMIPVFEHPSDILSQLYLPDFARLFDPKIYWFALTIALVASLETLLTVEAVDKMDPYKRITPTSRELIVQGIGNICAGFIGGLPMTQLIIRSSINIESGAKSRAAALTKGLLLLFTVIFIPSVFNLVPLASLASILLLAGYRLARPQVFENMCLAGRYHFIPFCATVLGLVLTDLLTGISIGMAFALIAILIENYRGSFYLREAQIGNKTVLRLSEQVSFLNKANVQRILKQLPADSEVVIDATRSKFIDYDIFEIIQNFRSEAQIKGIKLTTENLRGYGVLPPLETARAQTYDSQQSLTPAEVLTILKEGNERFVNNLKSNRNLLEQVNDTRKGQFPIAIILSCIDSRTSVELIFDQGLGDVFSARVAGNIVNDDILGSMEFACKLAGSKLIVVLGHTLCGAIKGACADVELEHLTGLLQKIKPAVKTARAEFSPENPPEQSVLVQKTAEHNVQLTVEQIRKQSPLLDDMAKAGQIDIVGAMYDVETGQVEFYTDTQPAAACCRTHTASVATSPDNAIPTGLQALGKPAV
ncbi:carbonic anhydrase family protein [Methylomicrobium sp. Wu6]|uniref:bifunctional SulP family inorganic anion transporter/carbonic anhydrase n=1 Tax=Methylomicrobium sp. Wu6 TaxID=3107928 RepID=UPI002DD61BBD|nr:carbonic anhydrase family protein [Methylomicrobium sp. Wu6]MEC4748303.1 carbonic anhydrase family protein [Methylomicrobium sp. Wu6]